jgi:hypothetical protein
MLQDAFATADEGGATNDKTGLAKHQSPSCGDWCVVSLPLQFFLKSAMQIGIHSFLKRDVHAAFLRIRVRRAVRPQHKCVPEA